MKITSSESHDRIQVKVIFAPKEYLSLNFSRGGVNSTMKAGPMAKLIAVDYQSDIKVAFANYTKNKGSYGSLAKEVKALWDARLAKSLSK